MSSDRTHALAATTAKRPLDSKSLKILVADELRRDIVNGVLAPGTQLKQDILAANFGVSRMPIREALLQLEAEGLVEFHRHRVATVRQLSADELRETFEIRILLECRAIELGVPNLTDRDISELSHCHKVMSAIKRWRPEWFALNNRFHEIMYNAAGRSQMSLLIASVQTKLDRYLRVYLRQTSSLEKSNREHAAILDACRRRDGAKAASLAHKHIHDTMETLLGEFQSEAVA